MIMKIWEVRTKKKMSLEMLAKKVKVSKSALNNYERNKRYPNMLQMEKIAKELSVKIEDLYESKYK